MIYIGYNFFSLDRYQTSLENQQIFTDLLDPQASDIKDIDNTKGPVIVSPESFVHILSSAHVLLSLKSPILDLCQTLGFIFAVIKDDDSVKVESFSSDISSKLASPLTFHVLQKRSCIQNTQNVFHLYILTCDLIQSPNQERSGTTIDLSNELFKSIGGEEVTLCNSPLLLLTSDEGSVYFSALSPHLSSHEQCNFSLLYPTSKPIKNVQSSRIALREKTNPGPDSALDRKVINGLVICSSNGDSAVLTCDKKYGAQYVPFTVPCSINDVKIVGTKMYVSSGEDLLVADFTLLEKDDKYYVEMDKMTSLKFAGALKIHCVLDTSLVEGRYLWSCIFVPGKYCMYFYMIQTIRDIIYVHVSNRSFSDQRRKYTCIQFYLFQKLSVTYYVEQSREESRR